MKLICLFYSFRFIYSYSSLFGQDDIIKLKMKEGHEYVFENINKNQSVKKDRTKVQNSESKLVFKLAVEKTISDSIIILTLNYKESSSDRGVNNGLIHKTDIFFPEFKIGGSGGRFGSNYVHPVLSSMKFRFSIQTKTGDITFDNRAEVLEEVYSRLKEKKYLKRSQV